MNLAFGHPLGGGKPRDISVSPATRLRSLYGLGATRSGKSAAFETWLVQDIRDGVGFTLIDPEARLTERMYRHLKDHGRRPVIIDPTRGVTPLNVLAPLGSHPYTVIEGTLQAFRRAWADSWGPRLEDFLRHGLLLLMEHNLTIGELPRLISDLPFRKRLVDASHDDRVKLYFEEHLAKITQRESRIWAEAVRNKAAALVSNPFISPCLSTTDCLNFQELMDDEAAVIVDLPEAVLGESGRLLAMLIVAKMYQAALRRGDRAKPHILYADEFQTIATQSFIDLTTRSAKRGVGAVVCHQSTFQPPFDKEKDFIAALLGNCAVQVVFQVGRQDAERFCKELFPTSGTTPKKQAKHWLWGQYGDYTPYSVTEERELQIQELEGQGQRECFVKLKDGQTTTVYVAQAYDLPEPKCRDASDLVAASLARWCVPPETVERERRDRLAPFERKVRPVT